MGRKGTGDMTGTKERNNPGLLIIATTVILMAGCDRVNYYADTTRINEDGWKIADKIDFSVPVSDTISPFDILFSIRTSTNYPFRNLFLFVTTLSPEGYAITDTVEYQLANEKGEWTGKGLGDIHDMVVPFKTDILFPRKGTYKFRIEQGMRLEELPGVIDFGIMVRHFKK